MYRLYAAISIIIGMYLDSVLFAKVNIAGVVPDCVLVVIVCMGIQLGATEAAAVGCAAGLVIDILFGKAVGINAIAYMVAGSVGGIFYKKYFAFFVEEDYNILAFRCGGLPQSRAARQLPLRGSWHRAAMTEGVLPKNKTHKFRRTCASWQG